jgi:ethanolamine utilization protein EutP (predicted NTPase)
MNGEGWVDVFACMKAWRVKEKLISKVIRLERKCGVKKGAVVSVVAYVDIDSFDSAKYLQQKLASNGRRRMIFMYNGEDLQGLEKATTFLQEKLSTSMLYSLFFIS